GSGKSLTMLWAAFKLRQQAELGNPTLLIVTDRTDLDDQIFATFRNAGFPTPVQARSAKHLRNELSHPVGQTIMSTVQKFRTSVADGVEVTPEHSIFVLTDEAHVTQYGKLAGNLRAALPHATFFAFTGTPIAKPRRNTVAEFGPVIDRYDHVQSVRDGVTVPIRYAGRLPELHLAGVDIDTIFDRVFRGIPDDERERLKRKYANRDAIAAAPRRIEAIAGDLIAHFEAAIEPNGFKGQVVAASREAALAYYQAIRELNGPSGEVLYTVLHNEEGDLAEHAHTATEEKEIIRRFKEEADPKLLIVCDKLLKGFDAPVEQVMYLDRPLREHTLLQAIGRVNRRMEKKTYGLVVDYWGNLGELQAALEQYGTDLSAGMVEINARDRVIARTEEAVEAALRFFGPEARLDDPAHDDRCVRFLEPEDRRIRFNRLFKNAADLMDELLPDPAYRRFDERLTWLARIRRRALNRYADRSLDFSDYGNKIQRLIADHLVVDGVTALNEPVSIYSPQFRDLVDEQPTQQERASLLEHRLAAEITVRTETDPVFAESLRERLERIIAANRERRMEEQQTLAELSGLLDDVRNPHAHGEQLEIDPEVAPYYAVIARAIAGPTAPFGERAGPGAVPGVAEPGVPYDAGGTESDLRTVSELVYDALRDHAVVGWQAKFDAQREMRRAIKAVLREHKVSVPDIDGLVARLVDLAKGRAA
ncbi:MAG TPA: type I restriction endonuclease subunit R, partial [Methanoregulaceae archaeon]|nr:type I restriction endonuclease subunit R [Methanoregulaceae archaeon]